jgi:hypothetical protein
MSEENAKSDVAHKVVAIMQTITEDLDDTGRKAWLKLLGLSDVLKLTKEQNQEKDEINS